MLIICEEYWKCIDGEYLGRIPKDKAKLNNVPSLRIQQVDADGGCQLSLVSKKDVGEHNREFFVLRRR